MYTADFVSLALSPDQPLDVISSYIVDKLSGETRPRLHLVAFRASQGVQTALRDLARESHGHYHGYSSDYSQQSPSDNQKLADQGLVADVDPDVGASVESVADLVKDSDINSVKDEIAKARSIIINIETLKHGLLDHVLLEELREVMYSQNLIS